MIPPLIIQKAISKKINLIAITDHNAIGNIAAVMEAAQGTDITVLPGIEFQTREEVHSICIFDDMAKIQSFFNVIAPHFTSLKNNAEFFGEQFIVDASGDFIAREERLLISSSGLTLNEAWDIVHDHEGLMIPAHVDRSAFGMIPVLGFIPSDIPITVVEVSKHIALKQAMLQYPQLRNYTLLQDGDAHFLEDIEGFNIFYLAEPTIAEIQLAFRGVQGRKFQRLEG